MSTDGQSGAGATPELIATCWTSAGDIAPLQAPELSPFAIEDRVAAVARTGWAGIGLSQDDLAQIRSGIGFPALRQLIADAGLRYTEVELLNHWWIPKGEPSDSYAIRELLFEAAEQLGATHLKIATAFGDPVESIDELVAPLWQLAEQAAERGIRLALEPLPFSMISSIPMGADLVRAVNHPACGLIVDTWHVFRAGTSLDELREALDSKIVFAVEIDDADEHVEGTLFEDTINTRRLCGTGTFDLAGFIATMEDIGYSGPYGVEIISREHRALPLDDALEQAHRTAVDCFAVAARR
ncbi:sugar phosphate isomerase/epimerase family protein [Rhodococcus sp. NPDC057014]|uniref:sugar phosphate isomerase/epimerase family protein n=1 Tax=Rhodococcus sp. NPDC057014 TaxID=3346000 RepID=UPI00363E9552